MTCLYIEKEEDINEDNMIKLNRLCCIRRDKDCHDKVLKDCVICYKKHLKNNVIELTATVTMIKQRESKHFPYKIVYN